MIRSSMMYAKVLKAWVLNGFLILNSIYAKLAKPHALMIILPVGFIDIII